MPGWLCSEGIEGTSLTLESCGAKAASPKVNSSAASLILEAAGSAGF